MAEDRAISQRVLSNFVLFADFEAVAKANLTTPLPSGLADAQGRFRVWAGNVGAQQIGKASLDNRLRNAPQMRLVIMELLIELGGRLRQGKILLSTLGNLSFLQEENVEQFVLDAKAQFQSDLDAVQQEVPHIIDCLYRISITLRANSISNKWDKSAAVDVSYFRPFDIRHIQDKFPTVDSNLASRLTEAQIKRRQYLIYRDRHLKKLSNDLENAGRGEIDPSFSATSASEFLELGEATKARDGSDPQRSNEEPQSTWSETTYASSPDLEKLLLPPVPKEAHEERPFECPFCRKIVHLGESQIERAWAKHVFQDLEPYVCTYETCDSGQDTYGSRHKWFSHLKKFHLRRWTCDGHCGVQFDDKAEFIDHLRSSNSMGFAFQQLEVLATMCSKPVDKMAALRCPLCSDPVEGTKRFEKHLGRHLEQLALFVLPQEELRALDSEGEEEQQSETEKELREEKEEHTKMDEEQGKEQRRNQIEELPRKFELKLDDDRPKLFRRYGKMLPLYIKATEPGERIDMMREFEYLIGSIVRNEQISNPVSLKIVLSGEEKDGSDFEPTLLVGCAREEDAKRLKKALRMKMLKRFQEEHKIKKIVMYTQPMVFT